jgi:hypothetical protein
MSQALPVLAVMLVAVAMALSLAHAAELPGKRRLDRATYLAVQPIYYPGFTVGGGIGEGGGILALIVLLALTPFRSGPFWWTLTALLSLIVMHAICWLVTHPVNSVWLERSSIKGLSKADFSFGTNRSERATPNWTQLRDAWEYSHVARLRDGDHDLTRISVETHSRAASGDSVRAVGAAEVRL